VAPKYEPPQPVLPPAFKELGEWKPIEPNDAVGRGAWWEIFGDAQLNTFEEQVSVSNNTLHAAEAQFAQARALVRGARAAMYPSAAASGSASRTSQSENKPSPSKDPDYGDFVVRADAAYEVDVWGRVRQTVLANQRAAQATAADLESVSLSLHAEVALDYFLLRAIDAEKVILDNAVSAYERALELTTNRYRGGIASAVDVAQAETQLESTRVQAIDNETRRAQLEHALAVLLGRPPASFSVARAPLDTPVPAVQPALPAHLLERRPDVAAAERRLAAASAQVGVATTAFYPVVALTGSAGFESATLGNWLALASNFWGAAAGAAVSVFDAGRRRAVTDQARAAYARSDAVYRETVLIALREVEDNLAALRVLEEEARAQAVAAAAAERLLTLATNRYQGGVTTYLEVVVAQTAVLNSRRAELNILSRRVTATVLLIKSLGGGWNVSRLPAR
jgi:NodT family efflux transporter outer membrane factor (OMF) lipoprotein